MGIIQLAHSHSNYDNVTIMAGGILDGFLINLSTGAKM